MAVDYLIVGQGIAGSLLCYFLLEKGKDVLVVDDGHRFAASSVAAGMVNPIMGRKLNKVRQVEQFLPRLQSTYQELGEMLGESFYHELPIAKPLSEKEQQEVLAEQRTRSDYQPFVDDFPEELKPILKTPHGGFSIRQGGWMDMPRFIELYRQYLESHDRLVQEHLDYEELEINQEKVGWKNIEARSVTFCEGYSGAWNPYFDWLPFKLAKGEILTIRAPDLPQIYTYNRGVYAVPIGEDCFRAGATYEWHHFDGTTTEEARQELTRKLDRLLHVEYEVIDQQAGVRPTVKDREPLLGHHPEYSALNVFNGMGTKAALLTPYYAGLMVDFLEGEGKLPPLINIRRAW